jgi:cysteine-rich repeat protein
MRGSAIAIAGGMLVGACVDLQAYPCSDDAQCTRAGEAGFCESVGYCSYPDAGCDSGRRFGELAAEHSGQCTTEAVATGSSTDAGPGPGESDVGESTQGATSSSDTGASESTGPLPQPVCGDGVVEGDEECDELDMVDGDGCNTDCVRSGSPRWSAVVASGSGDDRLFGLTQLVVGDVVAVGFVQGASSRDVLIVRYTPDGQEVQRVIHDVEGGQDEAEAVVQGGTGRVYVCGRATIGGTLLPWVARWDAPLDGEPDYQGEVPGATGLCQDVAYVQSSAIVLAGGNFGTAWTYVFGDGNLANGQLATATGEGDNIFKEAVRAPDAAAYVAGQVADLGVVYRPISSADLGMPLVQTTETVQLQSMAVSSDTIVVGGLLQNAPTVDDLWVSAYELDGTERWRYVGDHGAIDEVEDVAIDPAGNVYAIGHVVSDFPDRWVAKLDPAGALVWERRDYAGSEGDDRGRSIEVLPDGDLVVVAEITGEDGDLDGWIARLAP